METSKTPNWWSGLRRVEHPSTAHVHHGSGEESRLSLTGQKLMRFTAVLPHPQTAAWLTLLFVALVLLLPADLIAQSPWESSANKLQTVFTGTIAKALSLVAIVVGGLVFAYGEGSGKKAIAGIVFGVGMAVGAMSFMSWLFGG